MRAASDRLISAAGIARLAPWCSRPISRFSTFQFSPCLCIGEASGEIGPDLFRKACGFDLDRPALPRRPLAGLGQGQESTTSGDGSRSTLSDWNMRRGTQQIIPRELNKKAQARMLRDNWKRKLGSSVLN
jgi:hypothetical protein